MGESTLSSVTKMRVLDEMLGGVRVEHEWSILLLDPITTQVLSSICGVAGLLDYGVSLVDNVLHPREPQPAMTGIYFITPSEASINALVNDFTKKGKPQYRKVHAFFSSGINAKMLEPIRRCARLVEVLATLKETNLEYILYPDNISFTTGQEDALQTFFSSYVDATDDYKTEVEKMADRIATVFSTMKEMPIIRYRAVLPPGDEYPPGLESRLLLCQRLAVEVYDRLAAMQKQDIIPERETCDLIIMDRGFDPVAPIIHEWTYEAMAHDLLEKNPVLNGKIFIFDSLRQGGGKETKEHALDERDATFRSVRHRHFAAATVKITDALNDLRSKSRVTSRPTSIADMDLRNMSKLVQELPQYRDQLSELSVHVEMASMLNRIVEQKNLTLVGKLEQDLVYGDANSKDVISYFTSNQVMDNVEKVRLLMCYCATHQEKLDSTRQVQWQKIARLDPSDMATIINLEYLGIPVCKRAKSNNLASAITFGKKRKRAIRKDRIPGDEDSYTFELTRFVPLLHEVIEDAAAGKLSQDEYPYVRPPTSAPLGTTAYTNAQQLQGVTSFRTVGKSARSGRSTPEPDVGGVKGSRIYTFVIGGFTYGELRTAHRLGALLNREIILGGTSVTTPDKFMQQVLSLGENPEMASMQGANDGRNQGYSSYGSTIGSRRTSSGMEQRGSGPQQMMQQQQQQPPVWTGTAGTSAAGHYQRQATGQYGGTKSGGGAKSQSYSGTSGASSPKYSQSYTSSRRR